jgi:hypothetical protein
VLALLWAGVAGGSVAAGASSGTARAGAGSTAAGACAKRSRSRASCRRARPAAAYRRGARRGRALLAPAATSLSGVAGAPGAGRAGTPAPAPAGGSPPPPPGATPPAVASTIGAEAYDFDTFVLRLTRASVPAGELTIYFRNHDVSEHNLWIQPPAAVGGPPVLVSEAVGENGGATKTIAVTPGAWRLYCSLPGHEAMSRDLAVQ